MNEEWIFGDECLPRYDPADKQQNIKRLNAKDLARFSEMFSIEGLPDYIEEDQLKYLLLTNGFGVGVEVKGKHYILFGSLGGQLNEMFFPTLATVANAYLDISDSYEIGKNCIPIRCDSSYQGLMPILNKYNRLIVENELSMWIANILMRAPRFLSASDNKTIESAQQVIKNLIDGDIANVITDPKFMSEMERVQSLDWGNQQNGNSLISMIEYEQYLKGSKDMELGLRSPYNMKREALGDSEVSLSDMSLLPYIDNMISTMNADFEKYNKMFGESVRVVKNSAWKLQEKEMEQSIENQKEGEPDDTNSYQKEEDRGSNDDNGGSVEEN